MCLVESNFSYQLVSRFIRKCFQFSVQLRSAKNQHYWRYLLRQRFRYPGCLPEDPNNPGNPPEGFTGDNDEWHFNEMLGQWQLHVWTVLENPDGIFAPHNSAIGD